MLVQELMSRNPHTTIPDASVPDALAYMREKKVGRLPVLDKADRLVGIVSEEDLLYASPSPATSLSIFEINSLFSKIKVSYVMTKEVVTVPEDLPVEDAARIMADRRIGGLPVLRGTQLVGIVTETDLFRVLLTLLGGRRPGVRVTLRVPGVKGTMARISGIVSAAGGDIVGLGISENLGMSGGYWSMTLKIQDLSRKAVLDVFAGADVEVVDVRESGD
ncbi:MAG TPA: CBS domain-containing protein [Magnetospirillaceae bacterium]|nr:CBS domain-containing protein [Magnetospirillaceae bacterium]